MNECNITNDFTVVEGWHVRRLLPEDESVTVHDRSHHWILIRLHRVDMSQMNLRLLISRCWRVDFDRTPCNHRPAALSAYFVGVQRVLMFDRSSNSIGTN